jgi:twinkle protein
MFNELFGGARSELVILSGESGLGKTSWAMTWFWDTLEQGRPACILPMEMGPSDTMDHLGEVVTGKKKWKCADPEVKSFGDALGKWPLFLVDHYGSLPERDVHAAIYHSALDRGVKFFVVDHLEYIEKERGSRNEAYQIDECVRTLAAIAAQLKITILLIAHPSKRDKSQRKDALDIGDLKGTSGIAQTGGSVLIHHRPDEKSDETFLYLSKIRNREYSKYRGRKIRFGYDAKRSLYVEAHRD